MQTWKLAILLGALGPLAQCEVSGEAVLVHPCPRPACLSPDGRSLYTTSGQGFLMLSQLRKGRWSLPEPLPFALEHDQWDPCFSADGKRLFFGSSRPGPDGKPLRNDLWACAMEGSDRFHPVPVGLAQGGKPGSVAGPSLAASGNLYFFKSQGTGSRGDLFLARAKGQGFEAPEPLGSPVNTADHEYDPAVSRDERSLLFCRSRPANDGSDLYLSRRTDRGWTPPRKLGRAVNFGDGVMTPAWSPDGRWIFFTSTGGGGRAYGIYRLPASGLDDPRSPRATLVAPGRISRHGAFGLTLSPDGRTACFAEAHETILESRRMDGAWTAPTPLPFTLQGLNRAPSLSPDGRTLVYASSLPAPGRQMRSTEDWSLWRVRRAGAGWGRPERLGNLIDAAHDWYVGAPTLAADGTLAFTAQTRGMARAQAFLARPSTQGYAPAQPIPLGDLEPQELALSPDGKTLVVSAIAPGGLGGCDLYVSRLAVGGTWSQPRHLGPDVNSPGHEGRPKVSTDGRTVTFFSTRNGKSGLYEAPLP